MTVTEQMHLWNNRHPAVFGGQLDWQGSAKCSLVCLVHRGHLGASLENYWPPRITATPGNSQLPSQIAVLTSSVPGDWRLSVKKLKEKWIIHISTVGDTLLHFPTCNSSKHPTVEMSINTLTLSNPYMPTFYALECLKDRADGTKRDTSYSPVWSRIEQLIAKPGTTLKIFLDI